MHATLFPENIWIKCVYTFQSEKLSTFGKSCKTTSLSSILTKLLDLQDSFSLGKRSCNSLKEIQAYL